MPLLRVFAALVSALLVAGCSHSNPAAGSRPSVILSQASDHDQGAAHRLGIEHITVVIMENQAFNDLINDADARFIRSLAAQGVLFTQSFAVTHPSQPNYLALYSGSTQGVTSDACPLQFHAPSLGGALLRAGKSIKGYFEDLPAVGSTVCISDLYARKHNPLIDFDDTPPQDIVPLTQLDADLTAQTYPTVAFIVPNVIHDMHDGSVATGDQWLAQHLPPLLEYDATHHGILILTWDEDDRRSNNHIVTIAVGPMLRPRTDSQRIDHYRLMKTVTNELGLPPLTKAEPIVLPRR